MLKPTVTKVMIAADNAANEYLNNILEENGLW